MKNTENSTVKLKTENPENPFKEPAEPTIPEPTIPEPSPNEPNPYPVTDPIPEPDSDPFPTPLEPIPQFPPDVVVYSGYGINIPMSEQPA